MEALERSFSEITQLAKELGLDPYAMRYEICPPEVIYSFGAYGLPTRYNHWSFGKNYYKMKSSFDAGFGKIYELVINSDPCYAFLLDSNTLLQNKLICAHVLAHSDFFKHNYEFKKTNPHMLDTFHAHGKALQGYEAEFGIGEVENLIDIAMMLHDHKQVLSFVTECSPILLDWQRNVLRMIALEMEYFRPQMMTKIMNEGWATFWHLKLMRAMELTGDEVVDYAAMHASVISPIENSLNPYLLGLRIFEDLERKFGLSFLFEIRKEENDISFIRNYLTPDIMENVGLFSAKKNGPAWQVSSISSEETKQTLIQNLLNAGFPYLTAVKGESNDLHIVHEFENLELDLKELEFVLPGIYKLWGGAISLRTKVSQKNVEFRFDGKRHFRKFIE